MSITTDPTGFTTSFTTQYPSDPDTEFLFHKIQLADKIILNVQINGIMDTTFELPISARAEVNYSSALSNSDNDAGVEPKLLVGNHANLKILIVASQIGKLVALSPNPRDAIVSIGSRWFGKGDETNDEDFDKLMFILENVKKLLN